ncbi:MAG: hypothetical protein WCO77_00030 [bacterium]
MTQPDHNPSPEEMSKVFRAMQIRLRNYALHHFDRVNMRTFACLQNLDLLDGAITPFSSDVEWAVIRDAHHLRREKLSPGPLVVYMTAEEKPRRMVVELLALLYSESPEGRKTVLMNLDNMMAGGVQCVTPQSAQALGRLQAALESEVSEQWRPAVLEAIDVLNDDIIFALQGTRQCLESEPVIQNSLNTYVPRVMFPTISSLDSIAFEVRNPEVEHPKLLEVIESSVAEAQSLGDACARYYARLGYLPLAPAYSMGEVVTRWMTTHRDADAWATVWAWAQSALGPVPQYHACAVFTLHPELVPAGKMPELWAEILKLVCEEKTRDAGGHSHESWMLRSDLAKHFAYHLEANLPENDSANMAGFAWWFAEQVASLFPDEAKSAQFYRKNWMAPAINRSSQVWLAASSNIRSSYLRYMTFGVQSPWAASLLALMGAKLEQLAPSELAAESQALFHDALFSNLISLLPFSSELTTEPTFALECSINETALKWEQTQAEENRKMLAQLVAYGRTLGSDEGLCKALRGLADSSLPDQVAIALSLKAKAYLDPSIASAVWEVLSDGEWRQQVLGTIEERVLGLLIEAFSVLQASNQDKWFSIFPHFIAELCEKTDDAERRHSLFLYVVHISLASDTVSAVRRLLRGDQKAKFVEIAKLYRDRVESMWAQYPPWVQGRMRGLFANLHVV